MKDKEDCEQVRVYVNCGDSNHKDRDCDKGDNDHDHGHNRCKCDAEFAEVYSALAQKLSGSPGPNLKGQTALLEKTVYATSNIDTSNAAVNGRVIVNKSGWYDIATGICAAQNPIGSPLPVWTLSLFVNGVIVPGSTFASMTLSPEQKANEIVADVFVHLKKGDYVELANTSVSSIDLTAPTHGTNAQTNSAYMKIILLQAD